MGGVKDEYTSPVVGALTAVIGSEERPGLVIAETKNQNRYLVIPDGEVIFVRDMCNTYLKEKGARDVYGREVIDKESGNV